MMYFEKQNSNLIEEQFANAAMFIVFLGSYILKNLLI